jgi:hypothetical protein
MRILSKSVLIPILTLLVGLGGGFVLGACGDRKPTEPASNEIYGELALSHAALSTTEFTQYLKLVRQGHTDRVPFLLEIRLDSSLMDLARAYTPERDSQGIAARALAMARDYRTAYPHHSDTPWVAKEVQAALALKTPPVESPAKISAHTE